MLASLAALMQTEPSTVMREEDAYQFLWVVRVCSVTWSYFALLHVMLLSIGHMMTSSGCDAWPLLRLPGWFQLHKSHPSAP